MKYKYNDEWVDLSIKALDSMPISSIIAFAGTTIPDGWLVCDGSAISRTSYSELFNLIGTAYGTGDGSTTFNIPNLKGKVGVGLDSNQTEFDTLGETGGEKKHTLTVDEIPSHNHTYTHAYADGWKYQTGDLSNVRNAQGTSYTTGNSGGGQAHNNLQPYLVVNYIIKVSNTTPTMASIVDGYSTSTQDGYSCNYVNNNVKTKMTSLYTGTTRVNSAALSESFQNYDLIMIIAQSGASGNFYSKNTLIIPASQITISNSDNYAWNITVMESGSVYFTTKIKFTSATELGFTYYNGSGWTGGRITDVIGIKF